jgi:hypothetical protein
MKVMRHKLEASAINHQNGLQVEVRVGAAVAVQSIAVTEEPGRQLVFDG